jgi:alcohol dehydrogenase
LSKYGHELAEGRWALSGGLAEHIVLRAGSAIAKVSETLPAEIASPANCATSTVACALRYAGPVQGQRVLIFGAGMLGLTAAAMCDAAAAAGVTVVDTQPDRLALARRFGATQMVQWNGASKFIDNGLSETRQASLYDVVMEFSGTADGVAAALQHADIGARVLLVGTVMPTACVAMDPEQVVRRCLSIRGIHNYAPEDLLTAVRFLEHTRGRYPFDELVAKHFSLSDVNAAIDYAIQFRPVRIAVRP